MAQALCPAIVMLNTMSPIVPSWAPDRPTTNPDNDLTCAFVEPERRIELLTCSLREIAGGSEYIHRRPFALFSWLGGCQRTGVDDYGMRPECALPR